MPSNEMLDQIQAVLEREKVNCFLAEAAEGKSQPRLLAFLGNDYKNRERFLEIMALPQISTGMPHRQKEAKQDYIYVQFEFAFPFEVVEKAVSDISNVLHFVNRMIDLPGFEFDELNDKVFFRYVHLASKIEEDSFLYISILGLIMMALDLFTETLEKIATGQATFDQLLEQMIEVSKALQK